MPYFITLNPYTPMYRKLLFLLILTGLFFTGHSQLRQIYTDSKPNNEILKISFYSPSQGYIAFADALGFTIDSGRTFTKRPITLSNVDYNNYLVNLTFGFIINGVKAFSQDTLLAFGHYGLVPAILRSVNGGVSFKLIFLDQFDPLQLRTGITDMVFPQNGSIGFAVDADRILKTVDRGQTWSVNYVSPASYFTNLEAVDNNNVLALCTDSPNKLLKTTTGGNSWITLSLPSGHLLKYASFISSSKGWINTGNSNGSGLTYYTSDGGSSWTLKNNPAATLFTVEKMRFVNDSTGYALSGLFEVYKTTDSGKIWQRLSRDNDFSYLGYSHNDLHFWNANQFWAGGGHGFLEISTNAGGTPIPSVYFLVDTTGLLNTGTVKLMNYSKPGYQYQWFVNNTPLANSYHASYTHDLFSLKDSITLVVSNGVYADTLTTYQYFYPPVIVSSFTPTIGGTGTIVQIKGQRFNGATSVSFGGVNAAFIVLSDTSIRATVGSGASGNVQVATSTGRGSLAGFSYIPPPVISSYSPAAAKAGATVTITGQNFDSVTAVSFGGVPAASFTVLSSTSISAVVGVGASGAVSVTANGGSTSLEGFVIIPDISSFTPSSGTYGSYITITGSGFTGVTGVQIGGVAVSSFTVNSHSSITAIASTGASGNISVTAPGGTAVLGGFSYFNAPVISSISPRTAAVGTTLTIAGSNFSTLPAENIVFFGAVRATVTAATANALTVTVPPGASFGPLTVTTHNLTAYSAQSFTPTFANGGSITEKSFVAGPTLIDANGQPLGSPVIGDLDGDGKPDVAGLTSGSLVSQMGITLFRNTSTGSNLSFAAGRTYYIPYSGAIALADLDGDGKLDIVISDSDGYLAYIYRNLSSAGTFSFDTSFSSSSARMKGRMAIADIDGDGKPDLAFNCWWESKLIIHRNISNPGYFAFAPRIDITGASERNLLLRDLNADGKPELLDAGRIFVNTSTRGNISFAAPSNYASYTHSYVAVGDVDADGKPDIVTSDPYGSKAVVYRNTGNGTISLAPAVLLDAVSLPFGVELNDYDGDGKIDISVPLSNFEAAVLKNSSKPGSVSFAPNTGFVPGTYTADVGIISGDLNADGKPEIIVASQVLVNNVTPEPFIESFSPSLAQTGTSVTITGANFTGVTAVSFGGVPAASFTINSSSSITAIVGSGATGSLVVTNSYGTATRAGFIFGKPPVITSFSPQSAALGETITLQGTGFSSIAANNTVYFGSIKATVQAATTSTLTVTVPAGSSYSPISVTIDGLTGYSTKSFLTRFSSNVTGITSASFADTARFKGLTGNGNFIDADGDGKLDLLELGSNNLRISRNISTVDKFAFDNNYFILTTGSSPSNVGFGDIDGDGKQDIIVTHSSSTFVSVFLNNSTPGNFSFASRADFVTGYAASAYGPVVKDLDMDGKPDMIVAGYDPHTVSVFRNISTAGTANFELRIDYLIDWYATAVGAEDFDGDKLPDIVVAVNSGNEVSVFRNTSVPGTISFALKNDFAVGSWPISLAAGDIDKDGRSDIVVANVSGNSVSILQNTSSIGNINFTKTDLPNIDQPWTVWLNDLDGDGLPELAAQQKKPSYDLYSQAQLLSVYKNNSSAGSISFGQPVSFEIGDYTRQSSSSDINGDGRPDIAVFSSSGNWGAGMVILKNRVGLSVNVKICANASSSIRSNLSGNTFQWQQNNGSGFANISNNANLQGSNKDTLQFINVPQTWDGYQYRCISGTDTSLVYILLVSQLPVASAAPDTSVCAGSAGIVIGAPAIAGNLYAWTPATGLSSSAAANPIANPANTTSYTVLVTNAAGCSATDTVKVTVKTVATPVVSAAGPTSFCAGGNVLLSSSAASGNQWSKDGSIILNATAQSYTAAVTGNYTVKVTDISGCNSAAAAAVAVVAYPLPAATSITSDGPVSFCQGANVVLRSSDTGTHQWLKDGIIIPGAVNASYTVYQSGSYTAKILRGNCSSPASNAITVSVTNTIAAPSVSFAGTSNICNGDSLALLSSAASGNQWYRDTAAIPGAVQPAYNAKLAGNYSVRMRSNGCVSNASNSVKLTVNPIPTPPVISSNGPVLNSSSANGNQWYLEGVAINGATGSSYTATVNGNYSAKIILDNCASPVSNVLSVTVPNGYRVGPNPVIGKLSIWYYNNTDPLRVTLFDSNGKPVFSSGTTFTGAYEIDMSRMATGLYIVEIVNSVSGEKKRAVIIKI